jgi:hypothetical protein
MIRTKQPQVVDAMNRESAVVYMEACNRRESKEAQTVTFDVFMYTIESVTRIESVPTYKTRIDENGDTVNYVEFENKAVTQPVKRIISKREAVYKMSTFYGAVGNPTPSQYDDVMIAQIAFINSKVWDGSEVQKIYFWNLTASDVEKVSAEEMQELLTTII